VDDRRFLDFDIDNFDARLKALRPRVAFHVPNTLTGEGAVVIDLTFESLDDFHPGSLVRRISFLDELFVKRALLANLQAYMDGKDGAQELIDRILRDVELLSAVAMVEREGLDSDEIPAEVDDRFRAAGIPRRDLLSLIEREFRGSSTHTVNEIGRALATLAGTVVGTNYSGYDVRSAIPVIIAQLDLTLSEQLNQVLHHPEFQKLESAWRGLHYLVRRTETDAMLKIRVLNVAKAELGKNLKKYKGTSWDLSPIFKKVYSDGYGQLGGEPFALLVGDYEFDHSPADVELLGELSQIAAASHAPFISAGSPALFQMDSWRELPNPRDLSKIFQTPEYAAWGSLRESDDARYLALALPRVLARQPYGRHTVPVKEFAFEEDAPVYDPLKLAWMSAAYLMTANIARAFKRYGWCARIHGLDAGAAQQLPVYQGWDDDGMRSVGPTEVTIDDRREAELAGLGMLPLLQRKGSDVAVFMSAPSLQKPPEYDDANATATARIAAKLPFALVASRFVHYLKCISRDRGASWNHPEELVRFLNDWASNYVDDQPETSSEGLKAQRPLATAEIALRESDSEAAHVECRFFVRPHYQFDGIPVSVRVNVQLPTSSRY
jgi:type VI secretion system protein ImpC